MTSSVFAFRLQWFDIRRSHIFRELYLVLSHGAEAVEWFTLRAQQVAVEAEIWITAMLQSKYAWTQSCVLDTVMCLSLSSTYVCKVRFPRYKGNKDFCAALGKTSMINCSIIQ